MPASPNLYMFRSTTQPQLSCFCRDPKGTDLPKKFAPWTAFGVIRPDQEPPRGLSRKSIESGIDTHGYQLWRTKKKT